MKTDKTIDVLFVSRYIVTKYYPVTNMELQKLLYIVQRYFLRIERKPLFAEDFYAAEWGPYIPNVFNHYCGHGALPIRPYKKIDISATKAQQIDTAIDFLPHDILMELHKPWFALSVTQDKPWEFAYINRGKNAFIYKEDIGRY